jgi:hypothetical protein
MSFHSLNFPLFALLCLTGRQGAAAIGAKMNIYLTLELSYFAAKKATNCFTANPR